MALERHRENTQNNAMALEVWHVWLLIALALILLDVFVAGATSGVLLVVAIGALGGMVAALAGMNPDQQIVTAFATGLVSLPLVVLFIRRMRGPRPARGLPDPRLAGQSFVVRRVDGRLYVEVLGDRFPVRPVRGRSMPSEGDRVRIERFEGIHAIVRPDDEDAENGTGTPG